MLAVLKSDFQIKKKLKNYLDHYQSIMDKKITIGVKFTVRI